MAGNKAPATIRDATATSDKFAVPPSVAEAIALHDLGRFDQAIALLALIGTETLAKEADKFGLIDKARRVELAKCQYILGAYGDCLDNAGPVLMGSKHAPFGAYYWGALAASRLRLWPLVVGFTRGDPDELARFLAKFGDTVDGGRLRDLRIHLAIALARMDRFDDARAQFEKLQRTAKNQDEDAALRKCLDQLVERARAVRAGEIKPYDASALWLEALDSPSWWVQTEAMREVAKLPQPAVFDKLAARLKHPRWEVRDMAASALGSRGDRHAVELLRPLLQDPNANVRGSVRLALESLGEKSD